VNRPKSIDLKGVDPCSLLTDAQRQQLGYVGAPRKSPSNAYPGHDMCGMSAAGDKYTSIIVAVATEGVERFSDNNPKVQSTPIVVGTFPAVIAKIPGLDDTCMLGLDVADGQMVTAQVRSSEGVPQDQLCQKVQAMGEAVMTTLSSR
jgi:hypothetical protein